MSQVNSRLNMYMVKLDNKDAYCSIPIYEPHQKILKFEHKSKDIENLQNY